MLRFPMIDFLVCGAVRRFATLRIIHEMTRTVGHSCQTSRREAVTAMLSRKVIA
jgi:hypothetical protein